MQWLQRLKRRTKIGETGGATASPRLYLDHAATTPLCAEAHEAMLPYLGECYGNASAIHTEGRKMKEVVETARQTVATSLGIQPAGVTFTSGGAEGNNLAIRGTIENARKGGRAYNDMEIITTAIEHPSTTRTIEALRELGVVIHIAPVTATGRIDREVLRTLINEKTVLLCVSYVNSEIGSIEQVRQLRRLLEQSSPRARLYVDAAQAPLWLPCELSRLKADIMTFDGAKCGGPQGVGVLACRKGIDLAPITYGGGQERGLRPGTEPVAQIFGMATALQLAQAKHTTRREVTSKVRDYAIEQLLNCTNGVVLNGSVGDERVANNINISVAGIDSEYAVVLFDTHGVAISTKSACSSAGGGQSKVVFATTGDPARASSTLRITLGPNTTKADIDRLVTVLVKQVLLLTAIK